jgi:hypothetical protein
MNEQFVPQLAAYIRVLISALEQRFPRQGLDIDLANHIEHLLGEGEPDPAGEAEYLSWLQGA